MDKAEEIAWKTYPKDECLGNSNLMYDFDENIREGFIEGYRQAEKDCELTWEDMALINQIHFEVMAEVDPEKVLPNEIHQKVLDRFNQRRGLNHLSAAIELSEVILHRLRFNEQRNK